MIVVTERIAGEGVLQTDDRTDIPGRDFFDLLAGVCVHLEQPADALALIRVALYAYEPADKRS